jgi:hypothetical protein
MYNVRMTSLVGPQTPKNQSSSLQPFELELANLVAMGWDHRRIAKELEPDDKKRQKALRQKVRVLIESNPMFAAEVAKKSVAKMMVGLGPATDALVRRASKGRPDAIKLLYEASGFHNPRVKHEHSGDININLNAMPRPKRVETEDGVVDAEVVEE